VSKPRAPERWAADLSIVLRQVLGESRFPIRVDRLALEYSRQRYPEDPITRVRSRPLSGFEGALIRAKRVEDGWGIAFADSINSEGRKAFTIAHEFGHYLIHRAAYPAGFQCRQEDMLLWTSEYNQLEQQANRFAADLLMPRDDFRAQIAPRGRADLDRLGLCAARYGVSLTAATLRWLDYTERRAMLVVARDGFVLWARSSEPAFKSGAYIKTRGVPPRPVPVGSLADHFYRSYDLDPVAHHPAGIWLPEPVEEQILLSDRYDLTLSLLHLPGTGTRVMWQEEETADTLDSIQRAWGTGHS